MTTITTAVPPFTPGARFAAYNITATGTVSNAPGRLWSVVSNTAGTLTIADVGSGGTPGPTNEVSFTVAAGVPFTFPQGGWPITAGITIAALPASANVAVAFS